MVMESEDEDSAVRRTAINPMRGKGRILKDIVCILWLVKKGQLRQKAVKILQIQHAVMKDLI